MPFRFLGAPLRLFRPTLAGARLSDRLVASLGALIGIGLIAFVGSLPFLATSGLPVFIAPIGASAVLAFAVPASPLAQPWPIFGGNLISGLAGVLVAHLVGSDVVGAGLAVSLAIVAMSLARCLHPPGGAVALIAVIGGPSITAAGYLFPMTTVAANSAALVAAAWVFHRFSGHSYPHRPARSVVATPSEPLLHRDDIERALFDLGENFDIAIEDLDDLLNRAEGHARGRQAVGG